MQSGNAHLQAPAPAGRRPGFTDRYMPMDRPVPASAVRDFAPDPKPNVRTGRPLDGGAVFLELTPEQHLYGRRFGYAYINSPGAEVADDPKALVRAAILAAAPELQFEVLGCSPTMADVCLRFASPEDREAAVAKQPFVQHDGGVSVEVVREGEQRNVRRVALQHLAHIAFLDYPAEERTEEGVRANCSGIGRVVEIDPGCFAAPDLAPVHLVVQLQDPGSVPAGLRLRYVDHSRTVCPVEVARSFIPIQVVRVWEAQGGYTSIFNPAAA